MFEQSYTSPLVIGARGGGRMENDGAKGSYYVREPICANILYHPPAFMVPK